MAHSTAAGSIRAARTLHPPGPSGAVPEDAWARLAALYSDRRRSIRTADGRPLGQTDVPHLGGPSYPQVQRMESGDPARMQRPRPASWERYDAFLGFVPGNWQRVLQGQDPELDPSWVAPGTAAAAVHDLRPASTTDAVAVALDACRQRIANLPDEDITDAGPEAAAAVRAVIGDLFDSAVIGAAEAVVAKLSTRTRHRITQPSPRTRPTARASGRARAAGE
jgi:hypothetical protein